jgi:hypothetical protein
MPSAWPFEHSSLSRPPKGDRRIFRGATTARRAPAGHHRLV